jgi:acetylglutamate kinase
MPSQSFSGRTFVVRIDRATISNRNTLDDDLAFLMQRDVRPIVVAPSSDAARSYVKSLNRRTNVAVGLSGRDAALLPAKGGSVGRVQAGILATLTAAGYIPVIEPTALAFSGDDIDLAADDVAAAIGAATDAARVMFFNAAGGVVDPATARLIEELTPAEALDLSERDDLDVDLRTAIRAAAHGVRAGVGAAQIVDGRVAHAAIVEFVTDRHLGTQVTGAVFTGTL